MKALSIMQPWAWLIANGFKSVENRDWNTSFRGEFLIHAGKKADASGYEFIREYFPHIQIPTLYVGGGMGGIVGVATLDHVVHEKDKRLLTARDAPWFFGEYGFILENAKPLPFTPLKGQLGFFEVKGEIL